MESPTPKTHLILSLIKSALRLVGSGWTILSGDVLAMAIGFFCAELVGVAEELF